MKILIDNGHGENTPGKHSPDGRLQEWVYTREIADIVVFGLRKHGIDAERIVKENIDVPLSERCNRANNIYRETRKNAILVSIHCNAAGNGSQWMNARGWEAWTSVGQTKADALAEHLYKAAEETGLKTRKDMTDGDVDKEGHLYILKHTKCPAVLTENFFQDNKEDVEFLLSAEGKRTVANIHIEGIINYLNSK